MPTAMERAWLRLHLTRGLGRVGLNRLMAAFASPEAILAAVPRDWTRRAGIRPAVAEALPAADAPLLRQAEELLERDDVRLISFWDEADYPPLLRQLPDPPALLYRRGQLTDQPALAVVGARQATTAGRRLTDEICAELAARGIAIVSGLARGIDTAAHEGALRGSGQTVAVLGCGIDQVYPPENRRLFQRIAEEGALLSEYPPGTAPLAGHFPARNRIISGLAQGVLIVEAAEGSGSLITADFALEQGREVFAVPGPVYAETSGGVNRLLKEGAHLVTEPADILEVLWPGTPSRGQRQKEESLLEKLSGTALTVYRNLGREPLHIDELARKTGLTPMELSAILLHLELRGGVEQIPGMRYLRGREA
ncbi:DNA-processing protein DprA [Trichloromonas sp.]|uniref:DNA-processing protein DprA n=1 Tax=Trichloromonas sp. TaxID=3069249 RepID=UPI002A46BCF4|nr:DNA-processing protein DprA [Trichloromonas sp.]